LGWRGGIAAPSGGVVLGTRLIASLYFIVVTSSTSSGYEKTRIKV